MCDSLLITIFSHLYWPADREVQRILLELLNQMDGFDQNVNVKVLYCMVHFLNIPSIYFIFNWEDTILWVILVI